MIGPGCWAPPGPGRGSESYEAKCERWQETRESLRRRPNVTSCRRTGRQQPRAQPEGQSRSPRQQEFLRRRNLEGDEDEKAYGLPRRERHRGRALRGTASWADVRSSAGQQDLHRIRPDVPVFQSQGFSNSFTNLTHHSLLGSRELLQGDPSAKKVSRQSQGTQTVTTAAKVRVMNDASQQTNCGIAVLDKEIIQLSEYLREALQRELILKKKMVFLQELLSTLIQASERSWKGQMNEDQLKCKLRSLENQLYTCTQKHSEESVTKVLMEMEDQKQNYEKKAKKSLQKLLEEKMMAELQLQSTKRSLAGAEQECAQWKAQYEVLKEEWSDLTAKHSELETQLHILQCKLQGADSRDSQLSRALHLLETEHRDLQARLNLLQEEEAQGSQDAQELQGRLQRSEEEKLNLEAKVQHLQSVVQNQSTQLQAQQELIRKKDEALSARTLAPPRQEQPPAAPSEGPGEEADGNLRAQLQERTLQLTTKEKECEELQAELAGLSDEYLSCLDKLKQCREALNHCQKPPPRARRCFNCWVPVLVVTVAMALAAFLANTGNLML